jgi:TDG/mug DNA glycosylase family protein
MMEPILEDVLRPGLRVVFCGTAAGARSAAERAYYAHPGNRFWPTLHAIGLTPGRLAPSEWRGLTDHGIGLTDMVKHASGADVDLPRDGFDAPRVRAAIVAVQPRALAFNGKKAGSSFLGRAVAYGEQAERFGMTRVWVLPSTSGAASKFWSVAVWEAMAKSLS